MSSENKESAVVSQVGLERKMQIAYEGGLRTIAQIIPLLEYRQVTAKKYFSPGITSEQRDTYFELLEHINKEISKVMGL